MSPIVDISKVILDLGLASSISETDRALAAEALAEAQAAVLRHLKYNPLLSSHTEFYPQSDLRRAGRTSVWEVSDTKAYLRTLSDASSDDLQLIHIPIRSITSVYVDYDGRYGSRSGAFPASSLRTQGDDYWADWDGLDSQGNKICYDGILRSEGVWPDLGGSVKVVYTAGYTMAELMGKDSVLDARPIYDAIATEAVRGFLTKKSRGSHGIAGFTGPLTSENLGDYSYTTDSALMGKLIGGRDLLLETIHKLQNFMRMDLGVT